MLDTSISLYKLILLFAIDVVNFPLSNTQISEMIVGFDYMSYFHVQEALYQLIDSHYITVESVRNTSYYRITAEGKETLSYFGGEISQEIKKEIRDYLRENRYELRNTSQTRSDYRLNANHEYEVVCSILENNEDLFKLTVTVPTEEAARRMCNNWEKESASLYAGIMKTLMK